MVMVGTMVRRAFFVNVVRERITARVCQPDTDEASLSQLNNRTGMDAAGIPTAS